MNAAGIIGLGKALPKKVVKNADFVAMGLDTSDEWITDRTGIKERCIADTETSTSDLAYLAAVDAIADAKLQPEDIDLLIVATSTPDYPVFPSTAALLQHRLGLKTVGAFDVSAACTGFSYALTIATQFVQTGFAKNVLVIGADCLAKFTDWTDRSICVLFGDGAGAAVVSQVKPGFGILASSMQANGENSDVLIVPAGGSKKPISQEALDNKENFIKMNGKVVYKLAINYIVPAIETALAKAGLTAKDINFFVPHQANLRIIKYACDKLGLNEDQVYVNLQKYGNTSAASIPIALAEAKQKNILKQGDILVLAGFGAGFTWGTNIIRWGGEK
jgi:3-oxoacyl-[acyl-carrier-protein] synthase-3